MKVLVVTVEVSVVTVEVSVIDDPYHLIYIILYTDLIYISLSIWGLPMDLSRFEASPDDIAKYRERKAVVPKSKSKSNRRIEPRQDIPRHGPKDRFIKGPIPMDWLRAANKCGRQAMSVATLVWFAAGLQRSNPVKITPSVLSELAVTPRTARRVLERMQHIGLVAVEFHRGRSPLVTIQPSPTMTDSN